MTTQRVMKWSHTLALIGWAAAGVYGWTVGWQASIPFLYIASVWAILGGHAAALSGERPDQEVLDRLDRLERRLG